VLRVRVVSGVPGPVTLTVHAGPTNSGKTFDALAALAAAGRGVYAGPLRMLAREAHGKLSALVGEQNVGLMTGEEQENIDAPFICATVEAAPLQHGGVLVLDECHWLSDPGRGWAWTRALVSSRFEHVHAITDRAAADLVTALVPDAGSVRRVDHPRLSGLEFSGVVELADVPDGSAVVAFSRAAVLALAGDLEAAGRRPAVLYGALPPAARASQVERLVSGDADVIVTTDVIGHGINLPLTSVVLAQTQKFDGEQRRDLLVWEAAQILGRAGRFGLGSTSGRTFALSGQEWFAPDARLVEQATLAAAGLAPTGWPAPDRAPVRPTFGELGCLDVAALPAAVAAFAWTAAQAADVLPIGQFDASGVQARLAGLLAVPGALGRLDPRTVWGLAMCPVDDGTLVVDAAGALLGLPDALARLRGRARVAADPVGGLETAEAAAGAARDLRAVTLAVGDLPGVSALEAARWEAQAGAAVCSALGRPGALEGRAVCTSCGRSCAPWFPMCDGCRDRSRGAAPPEAVSSRASAGRQGKASGKGPGKSKGRPPGKAPGRGSSRW
jgi:ATP-dependent RNA helicase SUPV3L1/SUV3